MGHAIRAIHWFSQTDGIIYGPLRMQGGDSKYLKLVTTCKHYAACKRPRDHL